MAPAAVRTMHQRAQRDAVDHEDHRRVRGQPAQHPGDRRVADDEGQERRDQRRHEARAARVADLARLEQAGQHDGRDREQERVARGGLAVEAGEQAGGDRRARARDARDQRAAPARSPSTPRRARLMSLEVAVALGRPARRRAARGRARSACVPIRYRSRAAALDLVAEDEARRSRSGSCRGRCTSPCARRARRAAPGRAGCGTTCSAIRHRSARK